MMHQNELRVIEARCTQESAPRCRVACPLHLDVRTFVLHMARGNTSEARKILERHLPLPTLLCAVCDHPCENTCLRRDLGGSVAVSALEKTCLSVTEQQNKPFPRTPKEQKVAVLGAGFAGLTVASDIAAKGHPVIVYHMGNVYAQLCMDFPQLPASAVEVICAGLQTQHVTFRATTLHASLLEEASSQYHGVFVDASCCDFAPAREQTDTTTMLWRDNICCGGWYAQSPTGTRYASAPVQAGEGRCAAVTLHRLVTKVSLSAAREQEQMQDRLHTDCTDMTPLPRVLPHGEEYTLEEAAQEAARCIQCTCMQCVKECVFMQKYKEFPRIYARKLFSNATIVRGTRTANSLMNGCALCGQCTEICPERFSMAELCLEARRDAVSRDVMPESAHEFALEDMAHASGDACAFYVQDPSLPPQTQAKQVFFPGCQLAASRGEQVLAMHKHLCVNLDGGMALWSTCCGIPAQWAGREALFSAHAAVLLQQWEAAGKPRIIVACASCLTALKKALPAADITDVWSVLDTITPKSIPSAAPKVMSVQDPCGARHNSAWQRAVRSLAHKAGIRLEEARRTGDSSACCGYGGLVWNAQADVAAAMAEHRAAEFAHPILASCIMCRDRFARIQQSWHMFDILPMTAGIAADPAAPDPGLSARRAGRAQLKDEVRRQYGGEQIAVPTAPVLLHISDTVLQVMERQYILRQDVEEAVAGIERTGKRFRNTDNGHLCGSWRPRNVTFWVEYSPAADKGYILHDAWCHRMVVDGAIQPATEVILAQRVHA